MKIYPKLSLAYKFELVYIGDEVTAVSVDDAGKNYNGVVVLKNESSRFLFEKLQNGTTLPELINDCKEKYTDSNEEEIEPFVKDFIEQINKNGILVVDPENGIKVED